MFPIWRRSTAKSCYSAASDTERYSSMKSKKEIFARFGCNNTHTRAQSHTHSCTHSHDRANFRHFVFYPLVSNSLSFSLQLPLSLSPSSPLSISISGEQEIPRRQGSELVFFHTRERKRSKTTNPLQPHSSGELIFSLLSLLFLSLFSLSSLSLTLCLSHLLSLSLSLPPSPGGNCVRQLDRALSRRRFQHPNDVPRVLLRTR